MEREVQRFSPWDPGTGHVGMVQSCIREVQTRHQETFLYQEDGQTLEQASLRGGQCPKPVSVEEAFG